MKVTLQIFLTIWFGAATASAQTPAAPPASGKPSFTQEYGVIIEKNIFLRDRRSSRPTTQYTPTPPSPPTPVEKTYVLIGVSVGDMDSRAYFSHSGIIECHVKGDKIGSGTLHDIQVDGITYQADEQDLLIKVGQDLKGVTATVYDTSPAKPAASTTTTTTTTSAAPTPGSSSSPDATAGTPAGAGEDTSALSLEERMRRRRQEAIGH